MPPNLNDNSFFFKNDIGIYAELNNKYAATPLFFTEQVLIPKIE